MKKKWNGVKGEVGHEERTGRNDVYRPLDRPKIGVRTNEGGQRGGAVNQSQKKQTGVVNWQTR